MKSRLKAIGCGSSSSWPACLLLALACLLVTPGVRAQFSAAGNAGAELALESAGQRNGVASYGTRNIYRAGRTVRSGTPIEGDFHAAGSRVVLDAPVKGDASLAGGAIEIRTPLGGDLRSLSGKLTVDADVGGDALLAGAEIALERRARIAGDALIAGRAVDIRGAIGGELTVYAQQVVIAGPIGGKVRLVAEEIELLEGARIDGTLSYTSPNEIKRASGVVVAGEVTRTAERKPPAPDDDDKPGRLGWRLMGSILWSAGLFVFGITMMWAFPEFTRDAARRVWTDPLAALGLGFALIVAAPIAAGFAILTIIGIPLGGTLLALYPALLLTGFLVGVWSVALQGRRAVNRNPPDSRLALSGWLATALIALLLLGAVPFLGWLIAAWVAVAGVGGMALTLWGRRTPTA